MRYLTLYAVYNGWKVQHFVKRNSFLLTAQYLNTQGNHSSIQTENEKQHLVIFLE